MPLSVVTVHLEAPPPVRLTAGALKAQPTAVAEHRVASYVREQKNYSNIYVGQGSSYFDHWEESIQPIPDAPAVNDATTYPEEPSAFASPMLKPRATLATGVPAVTLDPGPSRKVLEPSTATQEICELAVPTSSRAPKSVEPILGEVTNKPMSRRAATRKPEDDRRKPQTRDDASGDERRAREEAEHQKRLTERRERRRAKKEIQRPPTPDSPSSSSSSSSDGEEAPTTKHKSRAESSKKKKKKTALPGAALMENFFADNLGKERITLKPTAGLGLFNKGRSSAAGPGASSRPPSKPRARGQGKGGNKDLSILDLFSELAFLKPARPTNKKRAPSASPVKSHGGKHREYKRQHRNDDPVPEKSASESERATEKRKKKHEKHTVITKDPEREVASPPTKSQERNRKTKLDHGAKPPPKSPTASSSSLPSDSELFPPSNSKQAEETQAPPKATRYLSPPWEIDGELIGDLVEASAPPSRRAASPAQHPAPAREPASPVVNLHGKWGLWGTSGSPAPNPLGAGGSMRQSGGEGMDVYPTLQTERTSRFFPTTATDEQAHANTTNGGPEVIPPYHSPAVDTRHPTGDTETKWPIEPQRDNFSPQQSYAHSNSTKKFAEPSGPNERACGGYLEADGAMLDDLPTAQPPPEHYSTMADAQFLSGPGDGPRPFVDQNLFPPPFANTYDDESLDEGQQYAYSQALGVDDFDSAAEDDGLDEQLLLEVGGGRDTWITSLPRPRSHRTREEPHAGRSYGGDEGSNYQMQQDQQNEGLVYMSDDGEYYADDFEDDEQAVQDTYEDDFNDYDADEPIQDDEWSNHDFQNADDSLEYQGGYRSTRRYDHEPELYDMEPTQVESVFTASEPIAPARDLTPDLEDQHPELHDFNEGRALLFGYKRAQGGEEANVEDTFARGLWRRG